MDHATLAGDVLHFFRQHHLSNVSLIGHSLCASAFIHDRTSDLQALSLSGGKVASALALQPSLSPTTLSSLIIVDVTPTKFPISSEFSHYANAMKEVESAHVTSAKEAQDILARNNIVRNHLLFSKSFE